MTRSRRIGAVLATAMALGLAGAGAQAQATDEHLRSHALRYASMVERAFGRLHGYIRDRATSATAWTGAAIPPPATGWEQVWTDAGVRARYCDDVLLVYIAPAELKGTGERHRAIQGARRNFLAERETGVRLPMLSWLESGAVTDSQGNTGAVPACMTSEYTAALPSGRAALSGNVTDPWTDVRERTRLETRESACPAGHYGVVRERRTVAQDFNAKGDPAGPETFGPWSAAPTSWCRADYTYNELFTRACAWTQGPPFNRTMTGTETWRIPVTVRADRAAEAESPPRYGATTETSGTPVFVATTCWDGPPPTPPVPTSTTADETETRTLSCAAGYTGAIAQSRTKTTATTTYPWGEAQLVTVEYTNWSETANTCTLIPPPPPPDDDDKKDDDTDTDTGEGGDGTDTEVDSPGTGGHDHPDEGQFGQGVGTHDSEDHDGDGAESNPDNGPGQGPGPDNGGNDGGNDGNDNGGGDLGGPGTGDGPW